MLHFLKLSGNKVPVNMIYLDMIAAGKCAFDARVGGYRVDDAMFRSIVYSDNEAGLALKRALGDNVTSRNMMARYSGIDVAELCISLSGK